MLRRINELFFSTSQLPRSPEIGAFVGYLKDKINPNEFSEVLSKRLEEFERKDSRLSYRDIPGLYLLFEKSSSQIRSFDRLKIIEFRKNIINSFPLLNTYPEVRVLYQDKSNQKLMLCCFFLLRVIRKVKRTYPQLDSSSFFRSEDEIVNWLDVAETIPADVCDVYVESCIVISKRLYTDLCESLKEDETNSIYHQEYSRLEYNYKLLQSFYVVTNLFPDKILNESQINSMSKQQMQELLHNQLEQLEAANVKLNIEVAEKQKAQEGIKRNELKLSSILESSMDVVIVLDKHMNVTFLNKRGEEIFGWDKASAVGQPLFDILKISGYGESFEEDFESFCNDASQVSLTNQRFEFQAVLADKQQGLIELRASRIVQDNEVVISAFLRDITESRGYENMLKKAKEQAELASDVKASFLSTMSHEVRTPLNAIIGMSQLLKEGNPRNDQIENIEVLQFSADNLLVIVNDILDFNKLEVGKLTISPIVFNLKEKCFTAISSYSQLAKEKGIANRLDWDDDLPDFIIADSTRLSQVLTNLINNAVKFTEEGSVTLSVKLLSKAEKNCVIEFSVVDTGMGIPVSQQKYIFDQFTQVDNKLTRKHGGTGLGLAICKRLVTLLGGEIQLESKEGKGSCFKFALSFNLVKDDAVIEYSEKFIMNKDLSGMKILVAEDYKINQIVIKKFLDKWNCEVEFANNGAEAVASAEKKNYDLILMDIQMPIMDGFEATRKIRKLNEHSKNIPIFALTASVLQDAKDKVYAAGMNDFITKPFKAEKFYEKLVEVKKGIVDIDQ